MLHWLVRLWKRVEAWFQRKPPTPKVYYPSNLHGRR